jgi:hypothetical protein
VAWYIAGGITKDRDYVRKFAVAAGALKLRGLTIINPVELDDPDEAAEALADPYGEQYEALLSRDLDIIASDEIEGVIVLPDWETSKGAAREVELARSLGKPVLLYPKLTPVETVLQEADRLVSGDRGSYYGHPLDDFTRTGRMWAAILDLPEVTPEQVGLCMAALKISREVHRHKRDNIVDLAGYAKTVQLVVEERSRRCRT